MDVVVTGGRGASGRWIVDRLVREGHAVTCLDRDHPGAGQEGVEHRAFDPDRRPLSGVGLRVVR